MPNRTLNSPTNVPGTGGTDADSAVAAQIARRTMAEREAGYAVDVLRLLSAGREVMRRFGTAGSPRVADIVAEAGVSNDVFYRHFRSKDELVTAILDIGTTRVHHHLVRRLASVDDAREKVRRWVTTILGTLSTPEQADEMRAIIWNAARVSDDSQRRISARGVLAQPLRGALDKLGSADPDRDSVLLTHAILGLHDTFLWRRESPSSADVEQAIDFCLRSVSAT